MTAFRLPASHCVRDRPDHRYEKQSLLSGTSCRIYRIEDG
jgi:hypothetical protein